MRKLLICSTMFLMIFLTGCNRPEDYMQFVIKEQYAASREDYEQFLEGNIDMVSRDIQKQFVDRVHYKPAVYEGSIVLVTCTYDPVYEEGYALFYNVGTEIYREVNFVVTNNKISKYDVKTKYGAIR